jgi:hypothetical protein
VHEIVRVAPKWEFDAFVWAMWLMYGRAPRKAEPDIDGAFDLGEVGEVRAKNWTRLTPSARRVAHAGTGNLPNV